MPEDRWLWGQPKTWHEMNRALADVSILLEYMGQLPDGRLQAYFEDTQSKIVTTGARRTAAPCRHYGHFLARLVGIATAFEKGEAPVAQSDPPQPPEGDELVDDVTFVQWSRDFLAGVAAPATVDSILLTREYMVRRLPRLGWLRRQT